MKTLKILLFLLCFFSIACPKKIPQVIVPVEYNPQQLVKEFKEKCPPPKWFDTISAKPFSSVKELHAYWVSKQRNPKLFFKRCYLSVLQFPENKELVVLAFQLMDYNNWDYPHLENLYVIALKYFYNYQKQGSGGSADYTGSLILDYSRLLLKKKKYQKCVHLIQQFKAKRFSQTNPHLKQLIDMNLANAYTKMGKKTMARQTLEQALQYGGGWNQQIKQELKLLGG
ncbi:MAG: hypothetical protein D6805_09965 [Planctomycetota bacterium]|nr:MAG: hypothetical protein D6805_09965 [Planctomycetota bacterium]